MVSKTGISSGRGDGRTDGYGDTDTNAVTGTTAFNTETEEESFERYI